MGKIGEKSVEYKELAAAARGNMGPWCKACPVCNGRACGSHMPLSLIHI